MDFPRSILHDNDYEPRLKYLKDCIEGRSRIIRLSFVTQNFEWFVMFATLFPNLASNRFSSEYAAAHRSLH